MQNLELRNLEAKSSLDLSIIYQNKGMLTDAYYFLKQYNKLNQELFSTDIAHEVLLQEFEYIQSKNERIKEVQNHARKLFFIIIFGSILLIFLILWIFIIRQKQKINDSKIIENELEIKQLKLADVVENQNKELISKILQLGNNEAESQHTIQKLSELKKEAGIVMKSKIQKLINDLEFRMNNDVWNEFEMRFIKVNPDFYNNLITYFPNLTSSEKRLCALLHLNFTTKEIAFITKQTHQSILVSKSRLRKKMNLPENIKLTEFLNTLVL